MLPATLLPTFGGNRRDPLCAEQGDSVGKYCSCSTASFKVFPGPHSDRVSWGEEEQSWGDGADHRQGFTSQSLGAWTQPQPHSTRGQVLDDDQDYRDMDTEVGKRHLWDLCFREQHTFLFHFMGL